jgi:3-dehydroquinate dehydratase-1
MLCVSLGNANFEECLEAVKKYELCELRLDKLKLKDSELKKLFAAGKKIIATYRPRNIKDAERMKRLKAVIDMGTTYVDIEVEATDAFKEEIILYAEKKKCKIIVSYHDYEKTPLREELKHIVEWCKSSSPDVIKIACHSRSDRDNARLLGLLDSDFKMIVIGMGAKGKVTRIFAPKLGAFCTYVTLSDRNKTAPGQLTKEEMEKILDGLYYV